MTQVRLRVNVQDSPYSSRHIIIHHNKRKGMKTTCRAVRIRSSDLHRYFSRELRAAVGDDESRRGKV